MTTQTANTGVLVLGAGLVSGPLFRYLADHHIPVTIATDNSERAKEMAPAAQVVRWVYPERKALERMVRNVQVVVSLLPATMHPLVAEVCIEAQRHLVTASYVSPEMQRFDEAARRSGITLLNEMGLDPGIDHMSALQLINSVREQGGTVHTFYSACGGIPAPESNDNPWGYKFSWNPAGVLRALNAPAVFIRDGKRVELAPEEVLTSSSRLIDAELGDLESYPNRDSTVYLERFGLADAENFMRATLRYPGWCATLQAIRTLGLLESEKPTSATWHGYLAARLQIPESCTPKALRAAVAKACECDAAVLDRLNWLGLLSRRRIPAAPSLLEAVAQRMARKMVYAPTDRDVVVLHHEVVAEWKGRRKKIQSIMRCFGAPGAETAMAKTVALPVAIAVRLLLEGRVIEHGVVIPTERSLYELILPELAELGVRFHETTTEL